MKTHKEFLQDQCGNALFLILIAVVLFAALSYAITQSNRGGTGVKSETASLMASQAMSYSTSLATGMVRIQLRDIDPNNVLFNTPTEAGYTTDTKLQLFHPDGGGVSWGKTDQNLLGDTTGITYYTDNGAWLLGKKAIVGIGSAEEEIVAILMPTRKDVCEQINFRISGKKDIPAMAESFADAEVEHGTYTLPAGYEGQQMYCIRASDDTDRYFFFNVLAAQ